MSTPDTTTPKPRKPWYKRKRIIIPGAVVVGIIAISAAAGGSGTGSDDPTTAADTQTSSAPVKTEHATPQVTLPSVVGMTPKQVGAALQAVGVTMTGEDPGDGIVDATDKATGYATYADGDKVDQGAQIMVEYETPKPTYTVAQQNAIDKAQSYLSFTAFSRKGLIEQLKFDKFTTAEATFGVDHAGANWNDQAVAKAKSYLDMTSFSRGSLIDQLVFDGFTQAQAAHGVTGAGLK